MFLVSPLLKRVAYPLLASTNRFQRWRSGSPEGNLSVLAYHGVEPSGYSRIDPLLDGNLVTQSALSQQLRLLKAKYNVISPEQFSVNIDHLERLPPRSILITCDDSLLNVLTDMLPVFSELELKGIFFTIASSCAEEPQMLWYEQLWLLLERATGSSVGFEHSAFSVHDVPAERLQRHRKWWEMVNALSKVDPGDREDFISRLMQALQLPADWKLRFMQDAVRERRFRLMNASELGQLLNAGMTVGSHTLSHPVLCQCAADSSRTEITESAKILEKALDHPISLFAFPFGGPDSVSARDWEFAKSAGYSCAFMNVGGCIPASPDLFSLPRVHITADMSLSEFEAHASGYHSHLQRKLRS